MQSFDWTGIPERFSWAAKDESGNVFVHIRKPSTSDWYYPEYWIGGGGIMQINQTIDGDWKDSLIERKK